MSNRGEQWKTDGNCKDCRRFNYCNKTCPAQHHRMQRVAKAAYSEYLRKKGLGPVADILTEGVKLYE